MSTFAIASGSSVFRTAPASPRPEATKEEKSLAASRSTTATETDEQKKIAELEKRDASVRLHEAAHIAAGGPYIRGGANFSFELGPNGKLYAIGGEVQIDGSEVFGDPQATIDKAQAIRRAALAPAQPSSQDFAVAAAAQSMLLKAQQDLAQESAKSADSKERLVGDTRDPAAPSFDAVIRRTYASFSGAMLLDFTA